MGATDGTAPKGAGAGTKSRTAKRALREDVIRHFIQDRSEELFIAHGYAATSMDMIAAECGMSKPTLYNHFVNKYELFTSLYVRFFSTLRDLLAALPASAGPDGGAALTQFLDRAFIVLSAKKNFLRMYFREQHLVIHENIDAHMSWHAEARTDMERLLAARLKGLVRPDARQRFGLATIASTVLNLLEGMISDLVLHEGEDVGVQKALIGEVLSRGLFARRRSPGPA